MTYKELYNITENMEQVVAAGLVAAGIEAPVLTPRSYEGTLGEDTPPKRIYVTCDIIDWTHKRPVSDDIEDTRVEWVAGKLRVQFEIITNRDQPYPDAIVRNAHSDLILSIMEAMQKEGQMIAHPWYTFGMWAMGAPDRDRDPERLEDKTTLTWVFGFEVTREAWAEHLAG